MMIKPYGDTLGDGAVQLSFTLPVTKSARAEAAARAYVRKLGFTECEVVHSAPLSTDFTFFVVYGKCQLSIDYDGIRVESVEETMDYYQVNDFIKEKIGRRITVVGGCTGSDAHTVGIDAIMNMKGYDQHYGLERYPMVEAINLGAQLPNEQLLEKARAHAADAILVSQVVTQKEVHIANLTELIELMEAENIRDEFVTIVGGPRIGHQLALELGFDAGFGRGTYPENVAEFIAKRLVSRLGEICRSA